jgi:sugar phosphate isomerase/epimerase
MWTLSAFSDEAGASCDEQITAVKRAGLTRIDIRSIDGFNITVLPLENAKTIKNKLDDAGVSVQMFGSPIGKIDILDDVETDIGKLRHLATLAPVLDCNAVRIFSYYNKTEIPHTEWREKSLANLTRLRDEAEKLGLVLYHENERHIYGDLGADVKEIAGLRDTKFKLIFDFDNYQQSGEDVYAVWNSLVEQTDSFHLKDSTSENMRVPVGLGNGQVEKILRDAVARNWNGPVAVEPHLAHSGAVALTGPSGIVNESYANMPSAESFHLAVKTATKLLNEIGAKWN